MDLAVLNDPDVILALMVTATLAFIAGRNSAARAKPDLTAEREAAVAAFHDAPHGVVLEIDALVAEGRTIAAVKRLRDATDLDVKRARLAVEWRAQRVAPAKLHPAAPLR